MTAAIPPFEAFYTEHAGAVLAYLRRRARPAGRRGRVPGDLPPGAFRAYGRLRARRAPAGLGVHDRHERRRRHPSALGREHLAAEPPERRITDGEPAYPRDLRSHRWIAAKGARGGRAPLRLRPDLRGHRRRARLEPRRRTTGCVVGCETLATLLGKEHRMTIPTDLDPASGSPPFVPISSTPVTTSSSHRSGRCSSRPPTAACCASRSPCATTRRRRWRRSRESPALGCCARPAPSRPHIASWTSTSPVAGAPSTSPSTCAVWRRSASRCSASWRRSPTATPRPTASSPRAPDGRRPHARSAW